MDNIVIKIIELEDEYVSKAKEFPYILSIKSKIRFRLRSKYCYDHQPILLIEKLQSFDYILPLKNPIDITSQKIINNFYILYGKLTQDGAWEVDLPLSQPGVVSFQLAFLQFGQKMTNRYGSYDTILLCQNKFQLRKLRKQTVFPRCIGRCSQWQGFFRSQKSIGYNSFHFAPIQQTGASNSYYSLKNHLELSSQLFSGTTQQKNAQLKSVLEPLKQQGMVFFVDIILNHTSFDSQWIKSAPDAVFTIENTPMLYTAFLVDGVIYEWGEQVKQMMSFDVQFTEEILIQIQQNLKTRLEHLQLHQYFKMSPQIQDILLATVPPSMPSDNIFAKDPVQSIQQFFDQYSTPPNNTPFGVTILNIDAWNNLKLAYEQNDLKLALTSFNKKWQSKIINEWIPEILSNTINNVRHNFIQNTYRSFDDPYPLVNKYFSRVNGVDGQFFALNNGWVGGNDSRELFVVSKEYYYLRRKVNAWGDLIRIRYGSQPSHSEAAWAYMLKYVRQMAKYFDGFRMDNLHGTPIFVARYMIREARRVNPNLIVFAQLFTNTSEETVEFVKQIGINSTLKEIQHLLSGDSIVDFFHSKINFTNPYLGTLNRLFEENGQTIKYAVRKRPIPLIYDLTHDNQTYISQKKTILHTPLALCLAFIGSFTGSTKGFDQFYSKKVEVTQLGQLYSTDISYPPVYDKSQLQPFLVRYTGKEKCVIYGNWDGWKMPNSMIQHQQTKTQYVLLYLTPGTYEFKFYSQEKWILQQKRKNNGTNHVIAIPHINQPKTIYRNLQTLRKRTGQLAEKYFDFKEYHVYNIGNIVVIIREPENDLQSICVIVNVSTKACAVPNDILLEGNIIESQIWLQTDLEVYQGLTTQTQIQYSTNIHQFFQVTSNEATGSDILAASYLPAGFGCFLYCRKNKSVRQTIISTNELISRPINLPLMGPLQINGLFFNCSQEEEHLWGQSNYSIPQDKNNQLVYAGFAGAFQAIMRSKKSGSLNEGIYQNLRAGNWLLDYYLNRARRFKHLLSFVEYLQKVFQYIGSLPRYLIPKYFANFIYKLFLTVKEKTNKNTDFQKMLTFATCQFINYFPNCSLPDKSLVSAGLPHFSIGWARCWGRDTFTATDLLRLHPSIYRETILQYASAMRHGLIPNLLDEGHRPRYNSRDACWWFMKGIIDYIEVTKDYQILKNKVEMLFLSNDKSEHQRLKNNNKKKVMLLEQIVQQIFQSHASGITFREWNSGYEIDSNMTSDGFNIILEVDADTGFILGGNPSNCLTWMDKMGSSTHAATKGVPSTPRAGSPVELVGLLYFSLCQFEKLNNQGHYTFNCIQFHGKRITFRQWADKIHQNFDVFFYLKESSSQSTYVKGIYKDLVGSPLGYDEQRFRPNALITLAVAPNLCIPEHANSYLKKVQEYLLMPKSIGVATLAEMHTPYSPFYDNSDDSTVAKIAHGFSYHNGPQWVWLYGFYLVAKINFQRKAMTKNLAMTLLQQHVKYIAKSQWLSLPELTNRNGQKNAFSCSAQAWSISSVLMALRHIETLEDDK